MTAGPVTAGPATARRRANRRIVPRLLLVVLAALLSPAASGVAASAEHALTGGYGPATPHVGMAGSMEAVASHPVAVAPAAHGQPWPGGAAITFAAAALAVPVLLRARRTTGRHGPLAFLVFATHPGREPPALL
ncbi:MAG: hypothetical protein GEV11_04570 [Streptosporangiales bacterium]|nr:hypothetical protein [Streptosporangiales bacterium]